MTAVAPVSLVYKTILSAAILAFVRPNVAESERSVLQRALVLRQGQPNIGQECFDKQQWNE
jgi:hypothetical protein